jgi:hypothetical protein
LFSSLDCAKPEGWRENQRKRLDDFEADGLNTVKEDG